MELPYKHKCAVCGSEWTSSNAESECRECRVLEFFVQLPPHIIAEADRKIFESQVLNAIKLYKDDIGIGLHEARDLYEWRAEYLRKHFPEKFPDRE